MARTPSFPYFKKDFPTVKIYRHKDGGYEQFTLYYSILGKATRRKFSDFKKAKTELDQVIVRIKNGEIESLRLSNKDRLIYLRAKDALKETGIDIDQAATAYAKGVEIVGGDNILEACRYFARRNMHKLPNISVKKVVDSFVESIDRPPYRKLIKSNLKIFADSFRTNLKSVQSKDIDVFLRNLDLSERSKKNHRAAIKALFIYAAGQGWITKDDDTMDSVRKFRDAHAGVNIITPAEMSILLTHAREEIVPWLTIYAFSTIRREELDRLDWADVGSNSIRITRGKGNVPTRRLIPIAQNLKKWIRPYRRDSGTIAPFKNMTKQIGVLSKSAGIQCNRNCLRHSSITYRVALTGNVERTALESGNSPAVIHQSYLELVEKKQAKAWFSIVPEATQSVAVKTG